jgi:hypothetical protein
MTRIEAGGWVLACDVTGTCEAYSRIEIGDPEECGCLYCRNFAKARELAYPEQALQLYSQLGIRVDREAETYEAGLSDDENKHLYGGWHHFIGRIEHDPGKAHEIAPGFSVWFSESRSCAEPVFGSMPLVQIEFFTSLPWLLEEQP